MLTPDNIYRIDFEEEYGGVKIPHTVIFNITQISEDEVYDLINYGIWEDCDKIVELKPKQLKYLQDKEEKATTNSLRRKTIEELDAKGIKISDVAKQLGYPTRED